uniref:amidase n=1 Tax=Tessaracoccus timonensis TaxID=2161816 RepID=UPI000D5553E5|nr:amidase [Tessaracoccus timonensis]
MDISELSAVELRDALRRRELSSEEVTRHFLERIADDRTNAFTLVTSELALARARELDASEPVGVIHGMPLADKDLHQRAGTVTTYGSRAFRGFVAQHSDPLTLQLDHAGAISLGKTATPEFGFAGYTSSELHGHTTIPGHPKLGAGGSSGGAAAAVKARLLPFAPGSDAGGSVRIPAAACGIVGLKPSRGRVPAMDGQGSLGQLAVAGTLARSVADAALLFDALIERRDGRTLHHTTLRCPDLDDGSLLAATHPGPRRRVGVLHGLTPWEGVAVTPASSEASAAMERAATLLSDAGHAVDDVAGPALPGFAQAFQVLWYANAAGLGLTDEQVSQLEPLTRGFVEAGRRVGAQQIVDAVRTLHHHEQTIVDAFDPFDAVLTPTTALTPRPVGWFGDDPEVNFRRQCEYSPHGAVVNVAGLPSLSLPTMSLADGLSMSVQLIGRPGEESTLVQLGVELEELATVPV